MFVYWLFFRCGISPGTLFVSGLWIYLCLDNVSLIFILCVVITAR